MIIVSQDKRMLINFDNVKSINILGNEIYIDDIFSDMGTYIAKYKTEERAKEVLREILNAKATFELFRTVPVGGREQTEYLVRFTDKKIILDTYEMPLE